MTPPPLKDDSISLLPHTVGCCLRHPFRRSRFSDNVFSPHFIAGVLSEQSSFDWSFEKNIVDAKIRFDKSTLACRQLSREAELDWRTDYFFNEVPYTRPPLIRARA
jgi:hypothetical protein